MKTQPKYQILVRLAALPILFIIFVSLITVASRAQNSAQERTLEDKIPTHIPIKIKLKNLEKEDWARELEVEIKNTGNKPIYFVQLSLILPESKAADGTPSGFPLRYGRTELIEIANHATPEDVPLMPGETYTLKLPERLVRGWELFQAKHNKPTPKRVVLIFNALNFGDGTGFVRTDGIAVPNLTQSRT